MKEGNYIEKPVHDAAIGNCFDIHSSVVLATILIVYLLYGFMSDWLNVERLCFAKEILVLL